MIKDNEKELLKNSWRLFIAFWVLTGGLASTLVATGFLNLPATANSVEYIRTMVSGNKTVLKDVSRRVQSFNTETALRKSRQVDIERRLQTIENQQREQRKDTKEILRIVLERR